MGLFDKFRKKVRDAASEVDTDSLSAEEGSDEALEALSHQEKLAQSESQQKEVLARRTHVPAHKTQPDFGDEEEALLALEQALCRSAQSAAHAAGAEDVELDISRDIRKATVENRNIFVEAQVQVTATGRPRVANL